MKAFNFRQANAFVNHVHLYVIVLLGMVLTDLLNFVLGTLSLSSPGVHGRLHVTVSFFFTKKYIGLVKFMGVKSSLAPSDVGE